MEASPDSKKIEFQGDRILELTMAALDTSVECKFLFDDSHNHFKLIKSPIFHLKKKASEFVPIFIHTSETNKYILCTLTKSQQLQQPLKLIINAGENVHFSLGCEKGKVYLTGYFLGDLGGGCGHDHEHDAEDSHSGILNSKDLQALLQG